VDLTAEIYREGAEIQNLLRGGEPTENLGCRNEAQFSSGSCRIESKFQKQGECLIKFNMRRIFELKTRRGEGKKSILTVLS
jgi:hypothetical protein